MLAIENKFSPNLGFPLIQTNSTALIVKRLSNIVFKVQIKVLVVIF